jgi:pimeloyl-ACP methyl ester carboxylesterase
MLAAGLSYREAGPADGPVALLIHGYPESSYMWEGVLPAISGAGWRAVAPDLAGFGDSPPDPPGTWTRHVESVERFRRELGIERCVPVMHDWGGLIGMRWACEHPDAIEALVISSTGFFPDGKWSGMAKAFQEPGTGEELIRGINRDGLTAVLRQQSPSMSDEAIEEYWKGFGDDVRRAGHLELYRSGDFSELEQYDLAGLGAPALLVWGEEDAFAPVAGARRFERELPDTETVVVEGAHHFVWDDAPAECATALTRFLATIK